MSQSGTKICQAEILLWTPPEQHILGLIYYRRIVCIRMGNTGINRSWLCLAWGFWGESGTKQKAEFPCYDEWLVDAASI